MAVPAKKPRSILFCIDNEVHTERAFAWYIDNLMNEARDTLIMIYIAEPLNTTRRLNLKYQEIPENSIDKSIPELTVAHSICTKYSKKAGDYGLKHHTVLHLSKSPGEELIMTAREKNVDMILMGSRGIGAIKRTLLGSVSDYVMHNAKRPVVIIPPMS